MAGASAPPSCSTMTSSITNVPTSSAAGGLSTSGSASGSTGSSAANATSSIGRVTNGTGSTSFTGVCGGFSFPPVVPCGGPQTGTSTSTSFAPSSFPTSFEAPFPGTGSVLFGFGYGGFGLPATCTQVPGYSSAYGAGGGSFGIKEIFNKPPVMKRSFDLYADQHKTF
ncbi:hypothetical protein F441_10565 [Phytophthora nicotianae CJ01A1]|uniref:Uncharacterized protein n=2 Tax=Phytophthora nicotianae TaxID=4792 RepID=W2WVG0_PHYNI|nr:hypothetical protein L915_10385 [Phytophthora nicotianae]ETP14506.1 hypothetical protein F441_10565 [Phytophthora nicotianae CJ01A1]